MIFKANLITLCYLTLQLGTAQAITKQAAEQTAAAERTPPQLPAIMLAQPYTKNVALADYWMSEKLDGIRAIWTGEFFITRTGKKINAPLWFSENFPHQYMDGELWCKRGGFHLVERTILDQHPDEQAWKQIKFMVFDLPKSNRIFKERYKHLGEIVAKVDSPFLQRVIQHKIESKQSLYRKLKSIEKLQGEGLMLRAINSYYQNGRTHDLLKLKSYQDAEAIVIGYKKGKGKYEGMIGALYVKNKRGDTFFIGTGLTDQDRLNPPKIGSYIIYQHNGFHHTGLPRFARYAGLRKM